MIKKFNLLFLNLFGIGKIKYAPGSAASLTTCFVFIICYVIIPLYIRILLVFMLYTLFLLYKH